MRKWLEHPIVPILLGCLIAWEAPGNIVVRSYTLLFLWLWLAWDVWQGLKTSEWYKRHRNILFCLSCGLSALAMMETMKWFLDLKLQEQRENVRQHLRFSHYIPSGEEDDPMHTIFTVTNDSSYEISRNHQIGCEVTLAVGDNGAAKVQAVGRPAIFNPDDDSITLPAYGKRPRIRVSSTLAPGSDAESANCLRWFQFTFGTDCADVTVIFWYSLETQPDSEEDKKERYIASKGKDGKFTWVQQPVNSMNSYCAGFYKGPSRPPFR